MNLIISLQKSLKKLAVLIVVFFVVLNSASAISSTVVKDNISINATKILIHDKVLAQKFAISYHHAVLEVNYADGYVIADLNEKEKLRLKAEGFTLEPANNWNRRYKELRQKINRQIELNDPKQVTTGIPGFECYPTVEETLAEGSNLADQFPQFAEWIDIGDSWKKQNAQTGFDLMVLKITNQSISGNKPILFIHSSMHAREYTPAALTLDFAKKLLNEYQTNPDIKWIVDYHEVHILFHMNPDGRKLAETGVLQRKNMNDNHCPERQSTGYMGVDLNRNFAHFWNYTNGGGSSNISCDQDYRGISAESEPETKAVSNYLRSLFPDVRGPNDEDAAPSDTAGMHLDFHSYSQLVLWPWGHVDTPSPNNDGFVSLGNKFAWFNNYSPIQSVGLYATDGTSDDISYGELGIAAFTFELGTSFFQQCSNYESTIKPDNLEALVYAAKVVVAPYLLAKGPEITQLELNGSISQVTVAQGIDINVVATANAIRSKQSSLGRSVSKIEYSVDLPIWLANATIIEFTDNDGNLSSGVEVFSTVIETSSLEIGGHTLFTQSYDKNGNLGVVSVAAFEISTNNNNSPIPDFSFNCTDLSCEFDATASFDSDGNITEYRWNLNGESSMNGEIVSYAFSQAGDKDIYLTVVDNSANQAETVKSITVSSSAVTPPTLPPAKSSGGGSMAYSLFLLLLFRRKKLPSLQGIAKT